MTLYNCKHAGDEYRITKFDHNLDVESSYLCNMVSCDCPAGVRPTCRHRQMLPKFIQRKAIDSDWMYDFDRGGWVQIALFKGGLDSGAAPAGELPADGPAPMTAEEIEALPDGLEKDYHHNMQDHGPSTAPTEWQCPKCGAQADERFDCCEVTAPTPKSEAVFTIGGFPDWCLATCKTPNECILVGCVKGNGTPPTFNITATEVEERLASMSEPENAIVEPLVDRIVDILQDHGFAKPTFRRRL